MLFGAHIGKTTGTWRKSSTELHIMPDTNTAGAQAFIKQNAELFKRVNDELRKYWPRVMEMYAAICPTRPDGSPVLPNTDFHEFVLNWDIECNFHTDKSDAGWGFCVVIPFGEFTGGELIFPGLGQSAHLIAGDIMVFPSALLEHGNGKVKTGFRHSLVLNCCANNFHRPYSEPVKPRLKHK
jgi:hypothetical protein